MTVALMSCGKVPKSSRCAEYDAEYCKMLGVTPQQGLGVAGYFPFRNDDQNDLCPSS